jgi:Phytanoyl-CoA dioxygenase (PhyH)
MSRIVRALRTVLLAPVWAVQLLTGAKSFCDNPLIGSRWLNALGLHAWRLRTADRLAAARRKRLAPLVGYADRVAFDRDGFVVKRDFLPSNLFAALLEQIQAYRGSAREESQGDAVTRRIACDRSLLAAVPAMYVIEQLPAWRGLIRYAGSFDAEPLVYVQTVLSHTRNADADPQEVLHSDTFHATVKAWLFLTDVEPGCMCFRYVPGSHRLTPQRLAWEKAKSVHLSSQGDRLSRRGSLRVTAEDLALLGLPPAQAFSVPANTLVVADTHGFHARGVSPKPALRAEIWAYSRRNPFLPMAGLDPWSVRALRDRRIGAFWWAGDMLEKLKIQRQVWRPRQDSGVFDRVEP